MVIDSESKPNLRIKMMREGTKSTGSGNKDEIIAKAFWFTNDIKKMEIKNKSKLDIKVAEKVIFDVPIDFDKNESSIIISGINNNSYPVKVYFREGESVKINNGNILTVVGGQYFLINSGFIEIKGSNGIINITGKDVHRKVD